MSKLGALVDRIGLIIFCIYPYIMALLLLTLGGSSDTDYDYPDTLNVTAPTLIVSMLLAWGWICCWVALVRMWMREDMCAIATWGLIAKLVYVPFYIFIAVIGIIVILMAFIPIPFMFFLSASIIIVFVIVDAFLVAMTSVYCLVAVYMLRKRNAISRGVAWGLCIMSFAFCLDIIAAALIRSKTFKANIGLTQSRVDHRLRLRSGRFPLV